MDPSDFIKNELIPEMVEKGILSPSIKSVEISPISTDGTFMLTICRKVKVNLILPNSNEEQVHHLVVKVTPKIDEISFKSAQFTELFTNEINAYTDIFNTMKWDTTKYYYGYNKPMSACIVLRDFSQDGYRMCKDRFNLPLDHIIIALKELGTFHGYSYALKESNPNQFKQIISSFKESRYNNTEAGEMDMMYDLMLREGPKRAINTVRNSSLKTIIPETFLQKLEKLYEKPLELQKRLVQPVEPLAIICHGDYLRNNIAFKYNEENPDTPTKALIFDFQTLRYASPMVDVCVFICNSTGTDVRTTNFDAIFNAYHDSVIKALCDKLGKNQNDLPEYYCRASFLKEYTKMLPFGLGIAGHFLPVLHEPEENMEEMFQMERTEETMNAFFEQYKKKGGEAVDLEYRSLILHIYDLMVKLELEL